MGRAIHATKSIFARIMTAGISEARRRAQTRMAFNVKAAMRRVLMAYRRPLFDVGADRTETKHRTCVVR